MTETYLFEIHKRIVQLERTYNDFWYWRNSVRSYPNSKNSQHMMDESLAKVDEIAEDIYKAITELKKEAASWFVS